MISFKNILSAVSHCVFLSRQTIGRVLCLCSILSNINGTGSTSTWKTAAGWASPTHSVVTQQLQDLQENKLFLL